MGKIMEAAFCAAYLVFTSYIGVRILLKFGKDATAKLFGAAVLTLVGGDAFHLIPRIIAAIDGAEHIAALGFGTLVTSFSMTAFYVIVFYFIAKIVPIARLRGAAIFVWALAAMRGVLLCFPQNAWFSDESPLLWGVLRNVPFVIPGAFIVYLLFKYVSGAVKAFKCAWLAVTLSFLFYIPVVLFAATVPVVGMLMLPKTACYVWLVLMGYSYIKNETETKRKGR